VVLGAGFRDLLFVLAHFGEAGAQFLVGGALLRSHPRIVLALLAILQALVGSGHAVGLALFLLRQALLFALRALLTLLDRMHVGTPAADAPGRGFRHGARRLLSLALEIGKAAAQALDIIDERLDFLTRTTGANADLHARDRTATGCEVHYATSAGTSAGPQ